MHPSYILALSISSLALGWGIYVSLRQPREDARDEFADAPDPYVARLAESSFHPPSIDRKA